MPEKLFLFLVDLFGDFDMKFNEQIPTDPSLRVGHSLILQSIDFARLRPRRNGNVVFSREDGNVERCPQRRLSERNRDLAHQISSIPFEEIMGFDSNVDIQIPWRTTAFARFPFASQAELHAVINSGRNLDIQLARSADDPLTATIRTLVPNARPATTTGRTRRLDAEETLRLDDLALSVAIVTFLRLSPGFGAGTIARDAQLVLVNLQLSRAAHGRIEQFDRQRRLQTLAFARSGATPLPSAATEKFVNDAPKRTKDVIDILKIQTRMTEAIIPLLFVWIAQYLKGFSPFFEDDDSRFVTGIAIRMISSDVFFIGAPYLFIGCSFGDTQ